MIFSAKFSYWSPLSIKVSYDGVPMIFRKVDFFGGAGGAGGMPLAKIFFLSKSFIQYSRNSCKKLEQEKKFFTTFFADLYPGGLIQPTTI